MFANSARLGYKWWNDSRGSMQSGIMDFLSRMRNSYRQHMFFVKAGLNRHCKNCGSVEGLSVDHTIPLSEGGLDQDENRQLLCRNCAIAKHGSSPAIQGDKVVARCRICHHAGFMASLGDRLEDEIFRHWTRSIY